MTRRDASSRGRQVVGLYGDPDTTWGIGVEAAVAGRLDPAEVADGLRAVAEAHPHLGPPGEVETVPPGEWDAGRVRALGAPFATGGPLVRAAVRTPDDDGSTRLVVAAHHGACDGLGLLALLGAATGRDVVPTTAGLGDRPPRGSFLARLPSRVGEALRRPPPRFPRADGTPADVPSGVPARPVLPEVLETRTTARTALGTVALSRALAAVWAERSARQDGRRPGTPLIFVGASRRPPGTVAPDRQTAYLRFRLDPAWSREEATARFAALPPEPDFPETSLLGLGPVLVRLMRRRLGATAVVSNLGVLEGDVDWVAMYPALSGPAAVSVGLTSTATHTTLSLRTRAAEYPPDDVRALADDLAERLFDQEGSVGPQ